MAPPQRRSRVLARFLSDLTLGFADGLTVPFAMTAGLSSLGHTQTVIYAGLAELCAGSFSMGIGGYLSALDEVPAHHSATTKTVDGSTWTALRGDSEESSPTTDGAAGLEKKEGDDDDDAAMIRAHLAPLDLPADVVHRIVDSVADRRGAVAERLRSRSSDEDDCEYDAPLPVSPITSGLSISLGYVIGGLIPLLPYLFIPTVGTALWWSAGLCLAALFLFGAGKSWLLGDEGIRWGKSLWEGVRMLVLGSLAASAAVVCISLAEHSSGED